MEFPRTALVLGLGRSGRAAAAALERHGVDVTRVDREPGPRVIAESAASLDRVELLVKSPGVPGGHQLVAEARRRGVPVWSELELGYRLLPDVRIAAVTGTNGKTTTRELLAAMLGAAVGGNEGPPLSELEGRVPAGAWLVSEVSSFQLEDVETFRPAIAILLNLEPDHLDRHGSVDAYRAAKLRLFENQTDSDTAVVPGGWGQIPGHGRKVEFSVADPLPAEPLMPGAHNRENAAAATAAARAAGVAEEAIADTLRTFPGVPNRLELVAEVDGVRYVNDSKATNVAAARRALAAYEGPMRVILGGYAKGESFGPLVRALRPNVRAVHLIGSAADELAAELDRAGVAYERNGDLGTAVRSAAAAAVPGDVVLLSPACASYDQFRDFEERGETFRRLVGELASG